MKVNETININDYKEKLLVIDIPRLRPNSLTHSQVRRNIQNG